MGNTLLRAASLWLGLGLGLAGSLGLAAEATAAPPLAAIQTPGTSGQTGAAPATEPDPQLELTDATGSSSDSLELVPIAPADAVSNEPFQIEPFQNESGRERRMAALIGSFTVFLLAVFVGFEIITKVPPTLHTPLMSGSNAISGITIVGAILTAGHVAGGFGSLLGMLAVILATINVVGGFLVTHRMLKMFKKR